MLTKRIKKTQLACLPCQRSHYSCDNERPCASCVRKNRIHECVAGTTKKQHHYSRQSSPTMQNELSGVDWKEVSVDLSFTGFDWWILDLQTKGISATNSEEELPNWDVDWIRTSLHTHPIRQSIRGREFHATFLFNEFSLPSYVLIYEIPMDNLASVSNRMI